MSNIRVTEEKLQFHDDKMYPVDAPKLTDWEKEPDVRTLVQDLEAAKQAHDSFVSDVKKWRDIMETRGSHGAPNVKGRSKVQPKLVKRQAEWRYSALTEPFLSSEKLFDVSPRTFEDADAARQNELVLNYQVETKMNMTRFIDQLVRADVDEGTVIVRVGWNRITKMVPKMVPVYEYAEPTSEEELQFLDQAIQLKNSDPRGYEEGVPEELKASVEYFLETGMPNIAYQVGEEEIEEEVILDNRPILKIVTPENFYWDPSCGDDFSQAGFCVETFETSKADLLKEPDRYKNLNRVNWETATPVVNPDHATNTPDTFNYKDELRKRVIAYEYWGNYDIHDTGELVPIVATWIGDVLIRLEENPFPDNRPPYVLGTYRPKLRGITGEPDAELLEENQKVLGAVSRGMIDLMGRSANSQQGFAKGMLDVMNRRRYDAGQDYEFNPQVHPTNGIIEHKYPEIPQSAMMMLSLQNQEAEALTGVKSFAGGMSGEAFGDVAAGIRGVLDAASKREMSILRRLANVLTEVGMKILKMNGVFLSEKEVIRITNTEFVEISVDDLQGEFDLKVDISTAEIDNNKAQDLAFLLQTIGNNMDLGIVTMILSEIARLKRMPELSHAIKNYQPQPDPIQEALKQAELDAKLAEIEKTKSEIELNRAKMQETLTKADQNNLNTIEQETGTKHERDLQKQRAQSDGNRDLEVTKSLLKSRKPDETAPNIDAAIGYGQIAPALKESAARNAQQRDIAAQNDPRFSLGSQSFDPALDPALNQSINL